MRLVWQNARGSITIEAAVFLPVILLFLVTLVFLSLLIYQKLVVLDAAVYTARQRAATWDNSGKNLETGATPGLETDGLYWRLTDFPGSQLVSRKLTAAVRFAEQRLGKSFLALEDLPAGQTVTASYHNSMYVRRTVSVSVAQNIVPPAAWLENIMAGRIASCVLAEVVEPVEYIRTIDLVERQFQGSRQKLYATAANDGRDSVKVFHADPNCRHISRIKPANLIEFDTIESANRSGYYLCLDCARNLVQKTGSTSGKSVLPGGSP